MGETAKPPPIRLAQSRNRYVLDVVRLHVIQLQLNVVLVRRVDVISDAIGIRVTGAVAHQPYLNVLITTPKCEIIR